MTRDDIYIAGLFYGMAKFIISGKKRALNKHLTELYSKCFTQFSSIKKQKFFSQYSSDVFDIALYNHESNCNIGNLLEVADWLSSLEQKRVESNDEKYDKTPLQPIFRNLFSDKFNTEKELAYLPKELSLDNIFPESDVKISEDDYLRQIRLFIEGLKSISSEEQLYFLIQKYFWSIPTQFNKQNKDISLFDQSKTMAAIVLCLYDQYQGGKLTDKDLELKNDKPQFMLINGDLSGIQDFIFNIPSSGAAKSLKGRSVYISLLLEVIADYLLNCLNLKDANLLYNGGGNFYILAPAIKEKQFANVREDILHKLLHTHKGDIYISLNYIKLNSGDLGKFSRQWDKIKNENGQMKYKKWTELNLEDNYNNIFGPFDDQGDEHCNVCGTDIKKDKIVYLKEEEDEKKLCPMCNSFIELTDELKNAKYLITNKVNPKDTNSEINTCDYLFGLFGYELKFTDEIPSDKYDKIYKLNDTNFLEEKCTGYKFGAFNLPINKDGNQIEFVELAESSQGDDNLGILKLDVDNLGYIFSAGFKDNISISRIISLSRMLGLFFKGYLNKLIKDLKFDKNLYVVFSGGDDTFIIGSWDKILDFTEKFYDRFRRFTCNNEKVTFSAGVGIFNKKYPVIKAAELSEENLDLAKHYINKYEKEPSKNKICLFGQVFNWEEFKRIRKIKELLVEMVKVSDEQKRYGRAILHKVKKSTLGFKKILHDSNQGLFNNIKFWNLAYYLREIKEDYLDKKIKRDYAKELIEEYHQIVVNNLLHESPEKKVEKIMIIPAAVKWAELETRNIER